MKKHSVLLTALLTMLAPTSLPAVHQATWCNAALVSAGATGLASLAMHLYQHQLYRRQLQKVSSHTARSATALSSIAEISTAYKAAKKPATTWNRVRTGLALAAVLLGATGAALWRQQEQPRTPVPHPTIQEALSAAGFGSTSGPRIQLPVIFAPQNNPAMPLVLDELSVATPNDDDHEHALNIALSIKDPQTGHDKIELWVARLSSVCKRAMTINDKQSRKKVFDALNDVTEKLISHYAEGHTLNYERLKISILRPIQRRIICSHRSASATLD